MQQKGFFAALFDPSFGEFITSRWIKGLFIIFLIFAGMPLLGGCFFAITLINANGFMGLIEALFLLAFLAVGFLVQTIIVKLFLEFVLVLFRIEEHTRELVVKGRTA